MSNTTIKRLEGLSPAEKRALLAELLQKKQQQPKEFPTSYAQQRLWFIDRLQPGSALYNVPAAVRLQMPLHVGALETALNEIVKRHESLRTVFAERDGQPVQRVLPELPLKLRVINLEEFSAAVREAEGQRLATQEAQRPFDLEAGPLVRTTLLRLGEAEHVLLLTMHHIVSDGWSMGVFFRELTVLYEAFVRGEAAPLPPLPIQYADFAVWQREHLQGAVLEGELSYWREQLAGAPAVLELPGDRARPAVQSYRGAMQWFTVGSELAQGLKRLSQESGATLFMTLLAAFKVLLYRYTGQADVVVGTPIANRNRAELEGLIGFFVNTLVLRTRLGANSTFRELLEQVKDVTLAAYAHQDLPFEKLVEHLQPERSLSHNPLFQVMFSLQADQPIAAGAEPPQEISNDQVVPTTSKFDMSCLFTDRDSYLEGSIEYNTDLFDDATITRFKQHFVLLLQALVATPQRNISELPLLSPAEQQLMIYDWNATTQPYPDSICFHHIIEQQAALRPEDTAVVFEDQAVSYKQLNERSNQLARHLQKLGVGPEALVGLCIERSIDMIVALLGILKAGAAYVPLDPVYPTTRLGFMIEDSNVSILLTQQHLAGKLPQSTARTVLVDSDWPAIAVQESHNLNVSMNPDNLVYVIYTSGSTGRPKGVLVHHRGLVNMVQAQLDTFHLEPTDRTLQFSSLSFDISIWDIALAFGAGATLCMATQESLFPGAPLTEVMTKQRVSAATLLPSVVNALDPAHFSNLHTLILGAEACSAETAARWRHGRHFINGYGPTETTVWATYSDSFAENRKPPIGRPIANAHTYVLDEMQQPVPIGVSGELYIGGVGVTRGYLHRPDLTAERYVPDPFSGEPGSRLYRTGDRVRYLPDGQIEFLGRFDHQVKVRGHRIELGEIDGVLNQHAKVREAVAVLGEDDAGGRLVAYVVANGHGAPLQAELREYIRERLPEYMIPSAFFFLERLPVTVNGKIDRKKLVEIATPRRDGERQRIAPRTPVEAKLAEIWQQVLKLDSISVDDNFFLIGGHSLLATQIISRVRDVFQIELPLRTFFESPTIAGLARVVAPESSAAAAPVESAPQQIPHRTTGGEVPPSFAQQRLWFIDQLFPGNSLYNLSGAFRISTPLHVSALEAALNEIVKRHESLRTVFAERDGQPVQRVLPELPLKLRVINLEEFTPAVREAEGQRLAAQEAQRPFDLEAGPLVRTTLLRLGEAEHVLLLTMHHIVSDGWSMGVFFRELTVLYEAFVRGEAAPLPPLPIQYADFAVWQREHLQGAVLEGELSYWREQLAGAPAVLELPGDRARPAVQSFRGAAQLFTVGSELAQGLKRLSQESGATLFMTLLAAFKVLLYRYTGQADVVVGTPIANRNRAELEGLIGFFVNTLVLRTRLGANSTFRELLEQVKDVTLAAYAHQDLPFEKLVEHLQPERSLSHNPLFQVMFVLQNAPTTSTEQFVAHSLPQVDTGAAKLDLTFYAMEAGPEIIAAFEYNVDIYRPELIQRMVRQMEVLLAHIVERPSQSIDELVKTLQTQESQERSIKMQEFKQRSRQQLNASKRRAVTG